MTARLAALLVGVIALAVGASLCSLRSERPDVGQQTPPAVATDSAAAAARPDSAPVPMARPDSDPLPVAWQEGGDAAPDAGQGVGHEPTPEDLATVAMVRHLSDARAAYADRDHVLALGHAERALELGDGGGEARWIAAIAACEAGLADRAQHHADRLDRRRFERVRDHCERHAVALRHPYDPPADAGP